MNTCNGAGRTQQRKSNAVSDNNPPLHIFATIEKARPRHAIINAVTLPPQPTAVYNFEADDTAVKVQRHKRFLRYEAYPD